MLVFGSNPMTNPTLLTRLEEAEGGTRSDALLDLAYANGAQAGYRLGYMDGSAPGDEPRLEGSKRLEAIMDNRRPALKVFATIKAIAAEKGE
jgi:hypothetical protein